MLKMSSISAQGVVERASAELSKRINGLGLRSKHHHNNNNGNNSNNNSNTQLNVSSSSGGNKTSVMERVTNVLCGNSHTSSGNNFTNAPEKPSRLSSKQQNTMKINSNGSTNQQYTPNLQRKIHHSHPNNDKSNYFNHTSGITPITTQITTIEELLFDDNFLNKFFLYFNSYDRRELAQVCTKWRDILYRSPRFWSGLLPILQCRELRLCTNHDRVKLYNSLIRRGFHAVSLMGATDEDALDLVHAFPLASKHVHSLSLRCSSVSDRGLEALLDHLQVIYQP